MYMYKPQATGVVHTIHTCIVYGQNINKGVPTWGRSIPIGHFRRRFNVESTSKFWRSSKKRWHFDSRWNFDVDSTSNRRRYFNGFYSASKKRWKFDVEICPLGSSNPISLNYGLFFLEGICVNLHQYMYMYKKRRKSVENSTLTFARWVPPIQSVWTTDYSFQRVFVWIYISTCTCIMIWP